MPPARKQGKLDGVTLRKVPIFMVGKPIDGRKEYSSKDLDALTKTTRNLMRTRNLSPAVKVGHRSLFSDRSENPRRGNITALYRAPFDLNGKQIDGILADLVVEEQLAKDHKSGKFPGLSVELYPLYWMEKGYENIDESDDFIDAVAFLGSETPAFPELFGAKLPEGKFFSVVPIDPKQEHPKMTNEEFAAKAEGLLNLLGDFAANVDGESFDKEAAIASLDKATEEIASARNYLDETSDDDDDDAGDQDTDDDQMDADGGTDDHGSGAPDGNHGARSCGDCDNCTQHDCGACGHFEATETPAGCHSWMSDKECKTEGKPRTRFQSKTRKNRIKTARKQHSSQDSNMGNPPGNEFTKTQQRMQRQIDSLKKQVGKQTKSEHDSAFNSLVKDGKATKGDRQVFDALAEGKLGLEAACKHFQNIEGSKAPPTTPPANPEIKTVADIRRLDPEGKHDDFVAQLDGMGVDDDEKKALFQSYLQAENDGMVAEEYRPPS